MPSLRGHLIRLRKEDTVHDVLQRLVERYPELGMCVGDVERAFGLLCTSYRMGGKTLICGNGGSAADAEHIMAELMKGMLLQRPIPDTHRERLMAAFPENGRYLSDNLQGSLPAISLCSQNALLTAYANDVVGDMAFAQQVYGYGREGDTLLALSTSGNSPNVIHALQVARTLGLSTIGITGATGGGMSPFCDVCIRVPCRDTVDVQERHLPIYHALCIMLEREFFGT